MNWRLNQFLLHVMVMGGITTSIVLCIIYPYLWGAYDGLATGLSLMAQAFGIVGLPLVPIGSVWIAYEFWRQIRKMRQQPVQGGGFYFAVVSLVIASLIVVALALVGIATVGFSLGLLVLMAWLFSAIQLIPRLKHLRDGTRETFNWTPCYLVFIPVAVLFSQRILATPLTQMSRDHAMDMATDIIRDIEEYRVANGQYPSSLLATLADYTPDVVGISQFYYEPKGDAYNLVFQQPRFLLDDIGVREFVVYNPSNQHSMISHASWILLLSPNELRTSPGWYATRPASRPQWKYFWFD